MKHNGVITDLLALILVATVIYWTAIAIIEAML